MIKLLLKVIAFFQCYNHTQFTNLSKVNSTWINCYQWKKAQKPFRSSNYILIAILFLGFSSIFSTQNLYGQCDTTIFISGISDPLPEFCENDDTDYELSVLVRPPVGIFSGTGVIDMDGTDSLGVFNPDSAGVGTHTITYTVSSGDGTCPNSRMNSIMVTVHELPDAGDDGEAFVCNESGASINLFSYLNGSKMTGGTWNTVRGVTPTTGDGTLNTTQISTLGAGVDTFTYTISGITPCPDSSANVILTITDLPMVEEGDVATIDPICEGESATVTINNLAAANYEIYYKISGPTVLDTFNSDGTTGSFNTEILSLGGNLTLLGIKNIDITPNCDTALNIIRTITVNPSPEIQGRDTVICDQLTFDLRLLVDSLSSGDGTVFGDNYGDYNYGSNSVINPVIGTTTYYVRDSVAATQCVDTTSITVQVFAEPDITGRDTIICEGTTLDLRDLLTGDSIDVLEYGLNTGGYTFSSGPINFLTPGTYIYNIRDSVDIENCVDTAQIEVTVLMSPIIGGRDTTICYGESVDLATLITRSSAGDSLEFGTMYGVYGAQSDSLTGPLTMTTTYFVRDSITGGCSDTAMIKVTVMNQPNLTTIDSTICSGDTIDLVGLITRMMPGDSLEFGDAPGNYGEMFDSIVFPSISTTYYVRDSVGMGSCADTASIRITVIQSPNIQGRDLSICVGDMVDLDTLVTRTVMGDGLEFGTVFGVYGNPASSIVAPTDTISYFIRDSIAMYSCSDTTMLTLNVSPEPNIQGRDTTVCANEEVDLSTLITGTPLNGLVYGLNYGDYSTGNLQNPTTTTTYFVRDSSIASGCVDTTQITVNIFTSPIAGEITGSTNLCIDGLTTLIPNPSSGTMPYMDTLWKSNNPAVASIDASGTVTGHTAGVAKIQYTIIDANGCQDTTSTGHLVYIFSRPVAGDITGDTSLCEGANISVNATPTLGSIPYTLIWSSTYDTVATINGVGMINGVDAGATSIRYIVSDNNGCLDTSNYQVVTVDSFPNIGFTISDADTTICAGDMVTFSATGGATYEFLVNNVSATTSSATSTYQTDTLNDGDLVTVAVTNVAGCQDTSDIITMNVDTIPDATLISDDGDNIIATGQTVIFTGNGGAQYAFSINNSIVQATSAIDTFATNTLNNKDTVMVEVFDGNNCSDTATIIITVNAPPMAVNDTVVVMEDALPTNILVQANDSDPEGDMTTTTIVQAAEHGSSTVINSDSISYMPNLNFNGQDSIVYQLCDNAPNCTLATVYITVSAVNDMPLATNDTLQITEDDPVSIIDVQANDSDPDGDSLITSIITMPGRGIATVMMDSTIAYTPMMDSSGVDVIVYRVCDTAGLCGIALVYIEITPVNDAPIAIQDSVAIPEDSMNVAVAILANDFDVDKDMITLDTVYDPTSGGSIVVSNDTVIYTPQLDFTGLDSIQYAICDTALCDTSFLIFNVLPINESPVAVKDSVTVLEDTSHVKIAFLENDIEVDGDAIILDSLFVSSLGITGSLTNDTLCYTPPANFNGLDSLKYIITDGVFKDSTYIIINVLPVNDPPIAVSDTVDVIENANPAIIAVQANDSDPDGHLFGTSIVSGPTNGTAIVSGGNVNYTPTTSFNGLDTIEYQICDTQMPSACDTAFIFITVTAVNDAPVAVNDTISLAEDTMVVLIPIESNDYDIDGDPTTISILIAATQSLVDSIRNDTLVYQPAQDYVGLDSILYQISDGTLTDQAWVYINMASRNDAPRTTRDSITILEDATNVSIAITINDYDVDAGDSLIASIVAMPTSGSSATIVDDTMLIYNPTMDFNGIDTIVYQVCDTSLVCTQDTVIVTVQPINDRPTAIDDYLTINEDTSNVVIDIQANDYDGDGETFTTVVISSTMTVDTLNGDSILITPPADFTGIQLIGYKICDTTGLCDTAIVTVTVLPINDPPVANTDYIAINQDTTNVGIDALANDTDIDDVTLTLTTLSNPTAANGSAATLGTDSILYTPLSGFSGIDTINYVVCDTSNACVNGLVIITVGFVNTPPVAEDDTIPAFNEDSGVVTLNALTNDSDINGLADSLKITNITTPDNGVATIVGDSSINYTPTLDFNGTDSLQYTVCDTSAGCAMAWVYFTITPVNDAPVAINDTMNLTKDTVGALIAVELNDSDIDGDATTITTIGNSTEGVILTVMNDSIGYTPNTGYVGVDTITYELSDGTLKDTALLFIFIFDPNNIEPVANRDSAETTPNVAINIDVQANDVDGNNDMVVTTIISGPNVLNTATVQNGDSILYTPSINFAGLDTLHYQICDPSLTCDTAMVVIAVENTLEVSAKVFLEGPYDKSILLMHDSLRKLALIPASEPYENLPSLLGAYKFEHKNGGGNEVVTDSATVFGVTGPDAIVDWVYLELLTAIDTIPVASRSALIQRDGDIVDVDGVSLVGFDHLPNGNYFLSIRHRNHLGVMTKTAKSFSSTGSTLNDFTLVGAGGTDAYGSNAMDTIETRLVLWTGDGNADRKVIFDGIDNDRDPVFFDVITDLLNINSNYNHIANGYTRGDFNMKGSSIYNGSGNDPDILFFNVFHHPENTASSTIFIILEQIPR